MNIERAPLAPLVAKVVVADATEIALARGERGGHRSPLALRHCASAGGEPRRANKCPRV